MDIGNMPATKHNEITWLKDLKAYDSHTGRMITKRKEPKAGVYLKNPKLIYGYFGDQVIVLNRTQVIDVTSLNFTARVFEKIQVPDYLKLSTMKSEEMQTEFLFMESQYLSGMVTRSAINNLKQYVDAGFKVINTRFQQDENLIRNQLNYYGGGGIFSGIGDIFEKIGSGLGDLTKDIFHGAGDLIKQGGDAVNKIAKTAFKGTKGLIKAGGEAVGGILKTLEMPLIIGGAVIAGIVMIVIIVKVIITKKATQRFEHETGIMVIWETREQKKSCTWKLLLVLTILTYLSTIALIIMAAMDTIIPVQDKWLTLGIATSTCLLLTIGLQRVVSKSNSRKITMFRKVMLVMGIVMMFLAITFGLYKKITEEKVVINVTIVMGVLNNLNGRMGKGAKKSSIGGNNSKLHWDGSLELVRHTNALGRTRTVHQ